MNRYQTATFTLVLILALYCDLQAGDCCVPRCVSSSCSQPDAACCQITPTCCTPRPQCCVLPPSCCGQTYPPLPSIAPAFFRFEDSHGDSFIIMLVTELQIREARAILNGTQTDRVHVKGLIVKSRAIYNRRGSYHLEPESICFFAVNAEVCDAAIQYVEDHLDEVGGPTLPGNCWCPWSSKLVEEVRRP